MSFDADAYRRETAARWERAAVGWGAGRERFQAAMRDVSDRMVDAIAPQPGHRVLEVAAGPGDTGFLAAQRIQPGGTLVCTDIAEPMLDVARARAAELGVEEVEFKVMGAEWLDLPTADVDAVLCRFGYMLVADPEAALREARRVLRPGGVLSMATWGTAEENPWLSVANQELRALTGEPPPPPGSPGPLSLSDAGRLTDLVGEAGFVEPRVEPVELAFAFEDLDAWWDTQLDLATSLREGVAELTPAQRDDLRDAIDARLAGYTDEDGAVRLPARALVTTASA